MKEKVLEKQIYNYLKTTWWMVESMQGGSVMIKKGGYNHRITLNSKWCPDIIFFYNKILFWFEIKKDQKEVDKWLKLFDRYRGLWKSLEWLKSYDREIGQFKYAELLEKNWWNFLVTCSLDEVKEFINLYN